MMKSRTPIDLSELKVIILDEADVFFTDDKNFATVKFIASHKHLKNRDADNRVQWILFSATYPKGEQPKVLKRATKRCRKRSQRSWLRLSRSKAKTRS